MRRQRATFMDREVFMCVTFTMRINVLRLRSWIRKNRNQTNSMMKHKKYEYKLFWNIDLEHPDLFSIFHGKCTSYIWSFFSILSWLTKYSKSNMNYLEKKVYHQESWNRLLKVMSFTTHWIATELNFNYISERLKSACVVVYMCKCTYASILPKSRWLEPWRFAKSKAEL